MKDYADWLYWSVIGAMTGSIYSALSWIETLRTVHQGG